MIYIDPKGKTKKRSIRIFAIICFIFLILWVPLQGNAQTDTPERKWKYLTDIYIMFPNLNGESGVGNSLVFPVEAGPEDIFSHLKVAGMIYLETQSDRWAMSSDFIYTNLQQEITPSALFHSGTVTVKQFIWEAAGLYRIMPFLEIGAGGRLNNNITDTEAYRNVLPAGSVLESGHHSKVFWDPILITRLGTMINEKWLLQLRGDLGGFGVGSDFTWQLQAYVGYQFTDLFQFSAGYRILSTDYDKGEDSDRFVYDVDLFGPEIRFGFNF